MNGDRVTASGATERLPTRIRARRFGREMLVHLAALAAVLVAAELILRVVDLRELRDSYEPGRALLFRHDAELGWAPVPNASATFTGTRTVTVHNNSLSLRDIEPAGVRKPTVLFVGDSFVWGYDVEAGERFTDLLRAKLPAVRIVNAGVPGYGTDQEYLLLRRIWDRLEPRAVVLMFCRSVPAFDSVKQMPPRFSPVAMTGRNRRFWSSVPKRTTTSHITELLPITPASPSHPREISSKTMANVVVSTAAPPNSSGMFRPKRPISCICRTSSCGYSLRWSSSEATGMTSLSTNFLTVLIISSCSIFSACTVFLPPPAR